MRESWAGALKEETRDIVYSGFYLEVANTSKTETSLESLGV